MAKVSITDLWVSHYHLKWPHWVSAKESTFRDGLLLKVHFGDIGIGYADLTHLGSFGIPSPEAQLLHGIARQTKSAIFLRPQDQLAPTLAFALEQAFKDAQARLEKRSLYQGFDVADSHWLITDLNTLVADCRAPNSSKANSMQKLSAQEIQNLVASKGKHWKIKVGKNPGHECSWFEEHLLLIHEFQLRIRLDANSALSEVDFLRFEALFEDWEALEYFEDPLPSTSRLWQSSPLPLAYDWEIPLENAESEVERFQIFKPALGKAPLPGLGIAYVTHLLEHPLGQTISRLFASEVTMALQTATTPSHFTWPNAVFCAAGGCHVHGVAAFPWIGGESFSNALTRSQDSDPNQHSLYSSPTGANWPQGLGWGFDQQLEALPWQKFTCN